ncbi:hypothetical protein OF83DRAFT_1170387 [Amylostereum chailletii]|nr:hypothetical protein OF83DRAFT_1170387 [Amylostereum chailletii]
MHVADTLASVLLWGMYTVFVFTVVHHLSQEASTNVNATRLFLVVGMYMLVTTGLISEVEYLLDGSKGGSLAALSAASFGPSTTRIALQLATSVLGVCSVLERVWEAWDWGYRVMLLPGVLLVSVVATGFGACVSMAIPMGNSLLLPKAKHLEIAFTALLLAVHTLASALILHREETHRRTCGPVHVVRTLVESGSMCGILWLMIFALTWNGIDVLHILSGTITQLTGALPTAMVLMILNDPYLTSTKACDDLSAPALASVEVVRPPVPGHFLDEKPGDGGYAVLSRSP